MSDTLDFEGRVVRDETHQIKIHQGTYYRKQVVDIRWYKDDKPTRKGIRLNKLEFKTMLKLLKDMEEQK